MSHIVLYLEKIDYYNLDVTSQKLIASYLGNRKQYVETNKKSDIKISKSGVPQGSVIDPKIFSLYINDIRIEQRMD